MDKATSTKGIELMERPAGNEEITPETGRTETPVVARRRGDLFAKLCSILVFFLGIVLIFFVFWLSYHLFTDPNLGLHIASNPKTGPSIYDIVKEFAVLVLRIMLLCLMSICGSLIANKGIHLYFSACQ